MKEQILDSIKTKNSSNRPFVSAFHDLIDPQEYKAKIEKKAYEIYESKGCRDGHDLDDWLEAERLLTRFGVGI